MKLKTVGTHSGTFHADEVVGAMLLTNFTHEFRNAQIVRSRDPKVLNDLDLILDVGDEYDPKRHRYDHHQKGFMDVVPGFNTKLSSSGLIYKHFGTEILVNAVDHLFGEGKVLNPEYRVELTLDDSRLLFTRMYTDFFEYLDAVDNGISVLPPEVKPRYKNMTNHLVGRIGRLNNVDFRLEQPTKDEQFRRAIEMAKKDFLEDVEYLYIDMFLGVPVVEKAIQKRFEVHPSGKIILLEKNCTWKSAVSKMETKYGIEGELLFVVFLDSSSGTYRVQSIGSNPFGQGFETRRFLKEVFRGIREEALQVVSGVPDAIFVHNTGFIGGAHSVQGAIKLAELSL